MREQYANSASDTLSASITNTDTSLTLTSAAKFPASGQFRILIDSEILLVTAVVTNTFTVKRAQEGTTAASHSTPAVVTQILTLGGLTQWGRDNVPLFGGSRPPYRLLDSTGGVLTSASFTGINTASHVTTTDESDGSITMLTSPAASAYAICYARSIPATPTLVAALRPILQTGATAGYMRCFVGFRESGTGKMEVVGPSNYNGSFHTIVTKYASPTSMSGTAFDQGLWLPGQDAAWLKVSNDGTNLNLSVGDGSNWIVVYSEAIASFFTVAPDQFVFGTNASGSLNIINRLVAWQEG